MEAPVSDALDNALAFAADGYAVFPVWGVVENDTGAWVCACGRPDCRSPGKHPIGRLVGNGVLDATTDPGIIAAWAADSPKANWAVSTDKLIVLDQDSHRGAGRLRELIQRYDNPHGNLPNTWQVSTGRDGARHYYFQAPPDCKIRNSAGRLGKHLDVRARGGYAIIPGSRHVSGHQYAFWHFWHPNDHPMAPCPKWLVELLTEPDKPKPKPIEHFRELASGGADEGNRHDRLISLTGHLAVNCVDPMVAHQLLAAWNQCRCRPPLDDDELEETVADIYGRELSKHGGGDG